MACLDVTLRCAGGTPQLLSDLVVGQIAPIEPQNSHELPIGQPDEVLLAAILDPFLPLLKGAVEPRSVEQMSVPAMASP